MPVCRLQSPRRVTNFLTYSTSLAEIASTSPAAISHRTLCVRGVVCVCVCVCAHGHIELTSRCTFLLACNPMKAWHGTFEHPPVVVSLFADRGHGLVATRSISKEEVHAAAGIAAHDRRNWPARWQVIFTEVPAVVASISTWVAPAT
jgi:hypothetical protein